MNKIVVGLTAGRKYDNYLRYLSQVPEVEVIKLGYEDHNFELIKKCNGLVLSGGEDVHPRFYNKPEYLEEFGLDDIDEERDSFELKAIAYAHQHQFSILGICRGLRQQIRYSLHELIQRERLRKHFGDPQPWVPFQ